MNNYVIYTDSACDVASDILRKWGVYSSPLSFRFDGDETEYTNETMSSSRFFARMRAGEIARTSAVSIGAFKNSFEEILCCGQDILFIGLSSTFSATYQSATIAAEMLQPQYPERKIIITDSLCACAGEALLVYLTVEQKRAGATLEEAAAFVERTKQKICHWITVDNLTYLKRGGRLSPTVTLAGTILGIKPLLRITDDGKLVSGGTARGRKKAIMALAEKYGEFAENASNGIVFIFHSECREAAEKLAGILKEKYHALELMISETTAVVGAQLGPGSLVCSFVGATR